MRTFLFSVMLTLSIVGSAQKTGQARPEGNGAITGKVVDASGGLIEYATITVYAAGNQKPVNGSISNAKGVFKVDGLAPGTYHATIDFIGYETIRRDSILISAEKPAISLGNIMLSKNSATLQNVTVKSTSPVIENKLDKMVYNVEKDVTSQGGVATDILKKVPQVFVDVDGNVELLGSTSIKFLINGKPSTIFGNSIADALQSIPASQIQSIEVITSPGAKYDAQGTGGIINIILKKSNVYGINGNLTLSAGTRLENGSFNLNYRHNKFSLNAYVSGNAQLRSTTINTLNRTSNDTSQHRLTSLLQSGTGTFERSGYNTGVGFDWELSKTDNLTGSLGYHNFVNRDLGTSYMETIITDNANNKLSDTSTVRNAVNNLNAHSVDWSLGYKKGFKNDKQELNISYNSSTGKNYSYYDQYQNYAFSNTPFSGSNSNNPGTSTENEFAVDYAQPVGENLLFETGIKNVLNKYNNASDVYSLNPSTKNYFLNTSQSSALNYKRNVYGYYLSSTFSLLHYFDVKAGGRVEYTVTQADYSNAHNVSIPSYYIFAPSLVISHSFSKMESLKLSYTHRLERPEYRELNPFLNLSDPHNISTGNPLLKPEVGNNFELSYNHNFEKGSNINVAVIFRKNTNDITSYTTYYPSFKVGDSIYHDVSLTARANINSDERYGVNLSGALVMSDHFTLRGNFFGFDQRIIDNLNGGAVRSGFGFRSNINGNYLVNKDLAFEFFGNFRSKETNAQGTQTSFVSYNLAMRKYFLNKKLSIGLTTTNPFNKYVTQSRETFGANFHQISSRQIPYRSFGISLMWKFGKLEFKKVEEQNAPPAPF